MSVLVYSGIPGVTGSLEISGLVVLRMTVGTPAELEFLASNTASPVLGALYDVSVEVAGVLTDSTGLVRHVFAPDTIVIGPGGLQSGQWADQGLITQDALSAADAGSLTASALLFAYVGGADVLGPVQVGDTYLPTDVSGLLTLTATVTPASSSGGNGTGNGTGNPPPSSVPPNGTGPGLPGWWASLSTAGKVGVVALGVAVLGSALLAITLATERPGIAR